MALANVNKAEEGSGSGPKYTGLAIMDLIAVNPSKEGLEKMGFKPKDDPTYLSTKTDKDSGKEFSQLRVSFFMNKTIGEGEDSHNVIVNHSIFLESRINYTKKDKVELIDKFGRTCYVQKSEVKDKSWSFDWIDKDSASPAIVGESSLVNFFRTISNSDKTDEISLKDLCVDSNRKTLFQKDGESEIKSCLVQVKKANGAKLKVLLGVRIDHEKDKVYQDLFSYNIGRVYADSKFFHKELHNLYKNKPEWFNSNYFGEIDYSLEKGKEEEYRLSVFDEAMAQSGGSNSNKKSSKSSPKKDDSFDDDFENDELVDKIEDRMSSGSEDAEDFDLF